MNMQSETHSPQLAAGSVSESGKDIILTYGDSPWLATGSFNFKHTQMFYSILVVFFLLLSSEALARQNTLTGSIAARQGYDSNIDRTDQNEISEWTTTLSPAVSITSEGSLDNFFLRYAPELTYNHRTDKDRIDHDLLLRGDKNISKRVHLSVMDKFVRAEDPYDEEESGIQLSDKRGRNRYWTNRASTDLNYTFAKDIFLGVGYSHHVLDNEAPGNEDYVKHNPDVTIGYRFTPQWQTQVAYSFTKGNFDQSDDLKTNTADVWLNFSHTQFNKFFGHYTFSQTDYDGSQDDYSIQSPSLGWEYIFNPETVLTVEGGASFVKRDIGEDKEAFFYSLDFHQKTQRGAIALIAKGGFDEQQFNGAADDGLSRYWSVRGTTTYRILKDLNSDIYLTYREDKYLERQPEQEEKQFGAGGSLIYSFSRWYSVAVRYSYSQVDADISTNEYEDNRLFMEFRAQKDLLKW